MSAIPPLPMWSKSVYRPSLRGSSRISTAPRSEIPGKYLSGTVGRASWGCTGRAWQTAIARAKKVAHGMGADPRYGSDMRSIRVKDDRDKILEWRSPPQRVVSLVPSDTYSLLGLGLGPRLVGRTRYCVEPSAEVGAIEIVGGTKDA